MNLTMRTLVQAGLLLVVTLVLLVFGAGIALGGMTAATAGAILVSPVLLLLLLQFNAINGRNWLFFVVIVLPFALVILRRFFVINLFGGWQVLVMALALFGLVEFARNVRREPWLAAFVVTTAVFLMIGMASTITGRSHKLAAIYQFVSNLKPLLAVMLGYALCWNDHMQRVLWGLVKWVWVPSLIFVGIEWFVPSLYSAMVGAQRVGDLFGSQSGIFPSRAFSLFDHPSTLAAAAAMFLLLAASRAFVFVEERRYYIFISAMYLLLIIFAVQRQELAGALLCVLLAYLLATGKNRLPRLLLVSLLGIVSATVFWLAFSQNLVREMQTMGIGSYGSIEQPRAQLFMGAWRMAQLYFPLGSGLGTYGGAGAAKFDHSVYDMLGFRSYWWYGKQDFLMDTYWPNSVAETGIFGSLVLLLSYCMLLVYAVKNTLKTDGMAKMYWLTATSMTAYTIVLSISSPAFQDLRLFSIPALMFGIAATVTKASYQSKEPAHV